MLQMVLAFMPRHPSVYGNLLKERIANGVSVFIVGDERQFLKRSVKVGPEFIKQLQAAGQAGPGRFEWKLWKGSSETRRQNVYSAGYEPTLHCKFGIVDDRVCWHGSFNHTDKSADERESVMFTNVPLAVTETVTIFDEIWSEARYGVPGDLQLAASSYLQR